MTDTLETSHNKSTDGVSNVFYSICEDDGVNKGLFYCQKCSKHFCDICVLMHNTFLKEHSVTEKWGGDNSPVVKTLELCEEHTTEKLTMFCEDDEKLLCHLCHLRNHNRGTVSHHCVDPNKIISITGKSQYNVKTATDKKGCCLTGICESSNGELVIADFNNTCVKILDKAYTLIEQIQLPYPTYPMSMCNISTNEVALTFSDGDYGNEIHFLRLDKGKVVKFNRIQMNHSCYVVAIYQRDLFVTSGTAVYQYTMDGRLVKTLYENNSRENTVLGVGVSPDGKRIYVTVSDNIRLLTLTRDGEVTNTLKDPAFSTPYIIPNLHVAATGQVFVLGNKSVSQVDTDGKTVLKTITFDMFGPRSVYFNEKTSKMVVGFMNSDNVIEFKTKGS